MARRRRRKQAKKANRLLTRPERKEFNQIKREQGGQAARDYRQGAIEGAYGANMPRYNLGTAEGALGAQYDMTGQQMQDMAQMNRLGQTDQFGNTIGYDEYGNQFQEMGGPRQQIEDWTQGQMGNVMNQFQQPFSYDGMQELGNVGAERQRIEDELYGRHERDISEQYGKDMDRFEQNMAERGIPMGSEAYNSEMQRAEANRADQLQDARASAVQGAGAEAQRMFGQQMGTRQQQIGEAQYSRNLPFEEMSAMGQYGQGMYSPQFQNYAQIQAPYADVTGAALGFGQQRLQNKQLRQQWKLANMGGGGGGGPEPTGWEELERRRRASASWNFENDPRYQQQGSSSSGGMGPLERAGIGAAGGAASGFGAGMAEGIFKV